MRLDDEFTLVDVIKRDLEFTVMGALFLGQAVKTFNERYCFAFYGGK
jgi:hypothetical protein